MFFNCSNNVKFHALVYFICIWSTNAPTEQETLRINDKVRRVCYFMHAIDILPEGISSAFPGGCLPGNFPVPRWASENDKKLNVCSKRVRLTTLAMVLLIKR